LNNLKNKEIGDVRGLSLKQIKKMEMKVARKNAFFKLNKVYKWLPVVTGVPLIKMNDAVPYVGTQKLSGRPAIGILTPPRYTKYQKIINYPWSKMGALQVSVIGTLGTGKSNLIHLTTALLAARGIRILTFNDTCFEARTLAGHGWFDKRGNFHPFIVNIWVPQDYHFMTSAKAHNPLWEHRDNVNLCEFEEIDQILDSMDRGVITVVYDDCYTKAGKLKLLIDLFNRQAERMSLNINNMFVHHELSTLIPENARKDLYSLVQEFSDVLVTSRRNRLGLLTSFHMTTEVFYRTVQKFSYGLFKRTTNRKFQSPVEYASRKLAVNEVNVSFSGAWMKHTIDYFPELPDIYRLVPSRKKIDYPKMKPEEEESIQKVEIDPVDFAICQLRAQKCSWMEIASRVGLSKSSVYERGRRLGVAGGERK